MRDAVMISPYLDEAADDLILIADGAGEEVILCGPVEPLRRFHASVDELEQVAAHIEMSLAWTLAGNPVFEMRYAEKWAAMMGVTRFAGHVGYAA